MGAPSHLPPWLRARARELPPYGSVHTRALHFGNGTHTELPHLEGLRIWPPNVARVRIRPPATRNRPPMAARVWDVDTTSGDCVTNNGRSADPSTPNYESSRLGDSKPTPPSRVDLAIASHVSGYGFGVGGWYLCVL
jgi:hypothetical protein